MEKHTSSRYDNELATIKSQILTMGHQAIESVAKAIKALIDEDKVLAGEIIHADKEINAMERQVDEQIVQIIAKRQPAAKDLRYIISMSKAVVDVERIGDEAVKIARVAQGGHVIDGVDFVSFAERVGMMAGDALESFADENLHTAFDVMQMDALLIDKEYAELICAVQDTDSTDIFAVMQTLWVLRSLERVGDHAKNLAEFVIYSQSGTDVRHADFELVRSVIGE